MVIPTHLRSATPDRVSDCKAAPSARWQPPNSPSNMVTIRGDGRKWRPKVDGGLPGCRGGGFYDRTRGEVSRSATPDRVSDCKAAPSARWQPPNSPSNMVTIRGDGRKWRPKVDEATAPGSPPSTSLFVAMAGHIYSLSLHHITNHSSQHPSSPPLLPVLG